MDDQNIKNAKQAANLALLQSKAKEFQEKTIALQNKIYQGTVQGISITMKGSHEVIEVRIDQSFYETSGKGTMEIAIMRCLTNLHNAIVTDVEQLQKDVQSQLMEIEKSNGAY